MFDFIRGRFSHQFSSFRRQWCRQQTLPFPGSIDELARLATESSITTHASEQCCSACRYMALVLAGLMYGIDRDEVLAPRSRAAHEGRS